MPAKRRAKASARASKSKLIPTRSTRTAKLSSMDSSSLSDDYKKLNVNDMLLEDSCEPAQGQPADIPLQFPQHTDLPPTFTSIPSEPLMATTGPLSRHAKIASAKDLRIVSPPRVPIFETTATRAHPTAASACPPPPDFGRTLAEPIDPALLDLPLPWDNSWPPMTEEVKPDPALDKLLPRNRPLLSMTEHFQSYAKVLKDRIAGPTVTPRVQDVDNLTRAVPTYVRFGFSFEAIAEKMEAVGYEFFNATAAENIWKAHADSKDRGQANIEEDGDALETVDTHLDGH